MNKVLYFILAIQIYFSKSINGHTYHNGGCPSVEPMSGFSMKQVCKKILFYSLFI